MKKGVGRGPNPFFIDSTRRDCSARRYDRRCRTRRRGSAARTAASDLLLLQAVHIRLDAIHLLVEGSDGRIGPIRALLRGLGGAESLRSSLLGLASCLLRALGGAQCRIRGGLGVLN